ncbi:MAG: hypothetical protein ACK4IX_13960 [Candidatus Sericytochromatia bacterium]
MEGNNEYIIPKPKSTESESDTKNYGKNITSVFDKIKLALLPLIYTKKDENDSFFLDLYHRFAGILEIIGYPSLNRHQSFFIKEVQNSYIRTKNSRVLLCGAMSPISIVQALQIMKKAGIENGHLVVIDISSTPYKSADKLLQEIAKRANIKLDFKKDDVRTHIPNIGSYGTIIADQVFNFIDPTEWDNIINHLVNITQKNGSFINIIAMPRGRNKELIDGIQQTYRPSVLKLRPKITYLYSQLTNMVNEQVSFIFSGRNPKNSEGEII